MNGSLGISRLTCPKCNHHKVWIKNSGTFCTRCGYQFNTNIRKPKKLKESQLDEIIKKS